MPAAVHLSGRERSLAFAFATLTLLTAASAAAAPAAPAPLPQLAGTYDAVHPHWKDSVTLNADGTYARGNGDPGNWTFDGTTVVLKWKRWGPEPVTATAPGVFADTAKGFTLRLRNAPDVSQLPGTYDGAHPHWKDSVTLNADGTYARGSGDPGRWYYDGKTLVLYWKNWGPEFLDVREPGRYVAASNGFSLAKRGQTPPTPPRIAPNMPPPAPAAVAAISSEDFDAIVEAVEGESFSENKIATLKTATDGKHFSVKQVGKLVDLFSFSGEKVQVVKLLRGSLVDPQNGFQLVSKFTFSGDKEEVNKLLQKK